MRWGLLLVGVVACRIADVDFTGKECPCPADYTCNVATQTCGHSVTIDAHVDSATGDGHGDASTVTCPAGVDICETFESGMLPVWIPGGSVTIDPSIAHRGTASLHAHLDALPVNTGARATLTEMQTLATSAPFWVRAWVNIRALPVAGNHLEIISVEQPQTPSLGDYVFFQAGTVDVYSQFTDGIQSTATGAATSTWICLLWHVIPAASASGELALSGDIAMPLTYHGATDGTPNLGNLIIGLQFASSNVTAPQPALDMWIDDIIIDHAAVTCAD